MYCAAEEPKILYRDDALAVCIKPLGIDSQNGMCALLSQQTGASAFCVHRLDRGVGGVMVYALSSPSAAALSRTIASGQLKKTYLAVCEGIPAPARGEMRDLLFHDAGKNKSFIVGRMRRGVREAVLDYETLDSAEGVSQIRVELQTGRTHQIRVQFASRGLPLVGDRKYGAASHGDIALWSHAISFPHPKSGETIRISAPPPDCAPWSLFRERYADDAQL